MADYVVARGCIQTNGKLVAQAGERYTPKSEAEARALLQSGVLMQGVAVKPEQEAKPEPEPEQEAKPEPEPEQEAKPAKASAKGSKK